MENVQAAKRAAYGILTLDDLEDIEKHYAPKELSSEELSVWAKTSERRNSERCTGDGKGISILCSSINCKAEEKFPAK